MVQQRVGSSGMANLSRQTVLRLGCANYGQRGSISSAPGIPSFVHFIKVNFKSLHSHHMVPETKEVDIVYIPWQNGLCPLKRGDAKSTKQKGYYSLSMNQRYFKQDDGSALKSSQSI